MAVETIATMIGYDLRDKMWISFCPVYDLDAQDRTIESCWDRLVDLCNSWVEWCLLNGCVDVTQANEEYLRVIDRSTKQEYATVELADLDIDMTGWIIIDSTPGEWQQGRLVRS